MHYLLDTNICIYIVNNRPEGVPALELPAEAAEHYGEIRAVLQRKGAPIGPNDLWIAAHARAAGLVLVSNNEREFKRVPGLKVENWARG